MLYYFTLIKIQKRDFLEHFIENLLRLSYVIRLTHLYKLSVDEQLNIDQMLLI